MSAREFLRRNLPDIAFAVVCVVFLGGELLLAAWWD